jgi:shikimate dehydrogenase
LAALGFRGANVTVPHKEAVLRALTRPGQPDAVAADAEALGAVNTLVVHRGTTERPVITGRNTDAAGFVGSLEAAGTPLKTISAVVVGAGGAARAVVFGLIRAGARAITILNRRPERAERIVADLKGLDVAEAHLRAAALDVDRLVEISRTADLLVNATPVGMWPHSDSTIWPAEVPMPSQLTVFDLVYNPPTTRLLQQARASGARAVDGLDMLVRQGALAFEMWTGEDAPVPVMRRACQRALGHGSGQ